MTDVYILKLLIIVFNNLVDKKEVDLSQNVLSKCLFQVIKKSKKIKHGRYRKSSKQ